MMGDKLLKRIKAEVQKLKRSIGSWKMKASKRTISFVVSLIVLESRNVAVYLQIQESA